MKRFSSPETLGAMVYPPHEGKKIRKKNFIYGTEFQAMLDGLDDEDCYTEENSPRTEKKRRLSCDQVKELEKIFEVDNRLEPERKAKIAEELGLQPRQVAIWFQNRRARWKTKQLERDYGLLEANYEALKLNYNKLEKEKEALIAELKELRAKLGEENTEINRSVQEKALLLVSKNNVVSEKPELTNPDSEVQNNGNSIEIKDYVGFKDGLSDSNCSGDFNIDSNKNAQLITSPASSSLRYSSWLNCLQFLDSRACPHQFVKMEEQSLFSTEDCGNFFSVDQAPTLQWHH